MNSIESKVSLSVVNIGDQSSFRKKSVREDSDKRMAPPVKSKKKLYINFGVNFSAERLPGIRKKNLPLFGPGAEFDDEKFAHSPKTGKEIELSRYHASKSFKIKDRSDFLHQQTARKENSRNQSSSDCTDQPVALS